MRTVSPRRRTGLVAAGVALAALVAFAIVGIVGLTMPAPAAPGEGVAAEDATTSPSPRIEHPQSLPLTSSPERAALQVALALFRWDTRGGDPTEWAQPIVDVTDPVDAPAVAADVRGYLPSPEQWETLRSFATRQWLTVDTVAVPDAWQTARQQAAPGQLPSGAIALTITGVRHRGGIWGLEPVHTERPVSFTIFLACPEDDACRILRLSRVDEPLE